MRPLPPPDDAPQRVRVTSSRRAPAAPARRPLQTELDEQTTLGEVYVRGLMGAQFRLAASIIVVGVLGLGGLPLLFWIVPATRSLRVLDWPIAWLLAGVVIYPVTVGVAAYYVRRADRIEADFTEMVEQQS